MKNFVRAVLLIAMLLVTAKAGQAQVSVGIVIGAPPPPRVAAVVPTRPDLASMWVAGYWYPVGHHYKWHEGYWTRPPYEGAHWVAPQHDGQRYYAGYWDGARGRVEHDHHSDNDRDRDYHDHERHDDHNHGRDDR
jgi:WXXGXW repeat (2 copies)